VRAEVEVIESLFALDLDLFGLLGAGSKTGRTQTPSEIAEFGPRIRARIG
jgi:hypothetical protein